LACVKQAIQTRDPERQRNALRRPAVPWSSENCKLHADGLFKDELTWSLLPRRPFLTNVKAEHRRLVPHLLTAQWLTAHRGESHRGGGLFLLRLGGRWRCWGTLLNILLTSSRWIA
jgi:hypothetical protein